MLISTLPLLARTTYELLALLTLLTVRLTCGVTSIR